MGFAVWRQGPLVYCQGTHEYRPMGEAILHEQCLLTARDFRPRRSALVRGGEGFVGYFASLGEVNAYLQKKLRRQDSHRILGTLR